MSLIKISIPNWSKYNPRSDRTNYSWFRFENTFFGDHKIFEMNDSQRILFIAIICEASKKNSSDLELSPKFLAAILNSTVQKVLENIQMLASLGAVSMAECRHDDGKEPSSLPATNVRTYERNERNERTNEVLSLAPKRSRPYEIPSAGDFQDLLGEYIPEWGRLYSADYVARETAKAFLWLKANPKKAKRTTKGWVQFFGGWFERGWDRNARGGPSNKAAESSADLSKIEWTGPGGAA